MAATYRRTQQGEWVVFAPASDLTVGGMVEVATKSGAVKHERIARVGRTFLAGGVEMAYGYPLRGGERVEVGGMVYRHVQSERRRFAHDPSYAFDNDTI